MLGILADAFTAANADADRKGKRTPADRAALARFARDARSVGGELGILQRPPARRSLDLRAKAVVRRGIDPAMVEARIAERAEARRAKDFARSDAVRDELAGPGGHHPGRAGRHHLEGRVDPARAASRRNSTLG